MFFTMLSSILRFFIPFRPKCFLSILLSNIVSLCHEMVTILFDVVTDDPGSKTDQRYVRRTGLYF